MNSQQDAHLDAWMEPEAPRGEAQAANPLLLVHRALRGRYLLAIAAGLLLAVPFALVGHRLMAPVYTSRGVVTIEPTRPVILYPNEANETITGFESFVRSQARMLESPRVMQDAATQLVNDNRMAPDARNWVRLQGATQVVVPRGSRDMIVEVTMRDPRLAQHSAQAILNAYRSIARDEYDSVWQERIDALNDIVRNAETDLTLAQAEARRILQSEGTVDLERRRLFVQGQVEALDTQLQAMEIEVPQLRESTPGDASATEQVAEAEDDPRPELTEDDYAAIDPEVNALLGQRRSIEQRMVALLSRVRRRHADYLAASDELSLVRARLAERIEELRAQGVDDLADSAGFANFQARYNAMRRIRDMHAREAERLSTIAAEVQKQQDAIENARQKIELARDRRERLETERNDSTEGRVRISQQAEFPFGPSKDRRMQLAAMGGMGGFGLAVAAFAAYGIFRPRYRFVADLEEEAESTPVLGLVPDVAEGRIEGDEAAQAGVHQIRSLLESVPHAGSARVIVVTSATAAEGKSTLAAALSASLARSRRRTLLIDGDLVGRGVTGRLSARALSGLSDLVADGGAITDGYIHEVEGRSNLDLMPAGVAQGFEPEQLSSQAFEDLIGAIRNRYDAIVVDTGPILGSLEANAAVPHADQTILVVSRGQNARLVKVAIERLRRFQAGRIGLVFNRATRTDIERSTSAASGAVRSRAASRQAAEQAAAMSASA